MTPTVKDPTDTVAWSQSVVASEQLEMHRLQVDPAGIEPATHAL